MRQLVVAVTLTGALVVCPTMARAADEAPSEHGFEIGFRTGVAIPVGDATSGAKLSDALGLQFPLWVDIGYRFGNLVVGGYGQWAAGLLGSELDCGDVSCSASSWRAGLEVQIHPAGRRGVDPWMSLGFGYEWSTVHASFSDGFQEVSGSVTVHGWDLGRLGLGVDFAIAPWLRIGPFVHATVSEFVASSVSLPGLSNPASRPIEQKEIHSWITIGVKLTGLL